ncbi:MAG: hypothetical protein Q4P07_06920 [Ornithinimicrobium sp.]|uniref:hypothetical protein n=1 Tax=Ornithinimicrobium sp. TaxID=1977084 RepID=UPI0026DEA46F|nr:hypothetical protein [Ornithinimicrobium sp.]MDO5739865.1 hypothetical protein [Ornithinimicrobium sp.]
MVSRRAAFSALRWSALALLPMVLIGVGVFAGLRRRAFAGVVALRGQVLVVALLVALFLALQG